MTSDNQRDHEAEIRASLRALAAEERGARHSLQQEEKRLVEFVKRLLASVRVVSKENLNRVPHTLCGVVAMTLFAKIFGSCRAILTLCQSGSSLEAPTLTRSAVEALITLRFITQEECRQRASRWAKYADMARWDMLKANADLQRGEEAERIRRRAEAIKKDYPRKAFWASGFGVPNLREMAIRTGLGWYYTVVYWSGSQPTHSSAIVADEYLEVRSDKVPFYRMSPSIRHARPELAAASDVLIQSLKFVNEAFDLEVDGLIADLTARYSIAVGK